MRDTPLCGLPHHTWPETVCTEPAGHYQPGTDPHAGPLIINGRQRGGCAWDEPTDAPEPPMPEPDTTPTERCHVIQTPAGPARITGTGDLTETDLGHLNEVIAAAKRRYTAEHPEETP